MKLSTNEGGEHCLTHTGGVQIPVGTTLARVVDTSALRVVGDHLPHLAGDVKQADPDGNKSDPNHEECWKDRAWRQSWLPGRQLLLL